MTTAPHAWARERRHCEVLGAGPCLRQAVALVMGSRCWLARALGRDVFMTVDAGVFR